MKNHIKVMKKDQTNELDLNDVNTSNQLNSWNTSLNFSLYTDILVNMFDNSVISILPTETALSCL